MISSAPSQSLWHIPFTTKTSPVVTFSDPFHAFSLLAVEKSKKSVQLRIKILQLWLHEPLFRCMLTFSRPKKLSLRAMVLRLRKKEHSVITSNESPQYDTSWH